jgi:ribosomal protein S14
MISKLQTSRREKKQRHQYKISEPTRRYYKFLKLQSRILGFMPLVKLPKVQTKNYCLVTGSAHSVYSKRFRLSRHQVKRYFGYINGLTISSW